MLLRRFPTLDHSRSRRPRRRCLPSAHSARRHGLVSDSRCGSATVSAAGYAGRARDALRRTRQCVPHAPNARGRQVQIIHHPTRGTASQPSDNSQVSHDSRWERSSSRRRRAASPMPPPDRERHQPSHDARGAVQGALTYHRVARRSFLDLEPAAPPPLPACLHPATVVVNLDRQRDTVHAGLEDLGTTGDHHPLTGRSFTSTAAINDGKWHQVVLASDGTNQAMYLDGALMVIAQVLRWRPPASPEQRTRPVGSTPRTRPGHRATRAVDLHPAHGWKKSCRHRASPQR